MVKFEGTKVPSFCNLLLQMISKQTVQELAQERIDELDNGCYLIDIKIGTGNQISVEIDNENRGIAVEDCMSVSRNIEHNLDREIEDFALQVSSPGLSEPFKVWRQYRKNIGRDVKVKLLEGSPLKGEILAADETGIQLKTQTKQRVEGRKKKETIVETHQLEYNQIKETKIIISFK